MRINAVLIGVACLTCVSGCTLAKGHDVYALRAEVTTGAEGSDGNVSLCWTVNGEDECHDLSSNIDDFESGAHQYFDVNPKNRWDVSVTPSAVWLTYDPGLSLGDSWELASLRVTAYGSDDSQRVLCEIEPHAKVSGSVTCL